MTKLRAHVCACVCDKVVSGNVECDNAAFVCDKFVCGIVVVVVVAAAAVVV